MSEIVKQETAPMMSESAHFDLVVKQADILAKSSIVPKAYRGKSADIIAAGLAGRAFNWDTMTSMRNYHVIEGSASLRPEAMLGLVRLHGHSVDFREESDAVVAIGTRHDTGDTYEARFSIADAQAAGLAGKRNWKQYQNAMLTWRAVGKLCRYLFSDVVLGAGYVPEEIGADTNADGEVLEAEIVETDVSHIEPVDPFALEGAGWLSAGEAKTQLLEACEGDKELAQQIWGDKGSAEMHEDSLATLIKQAVEVLDSKRQHQNETDDEVVAEEVEMF
jgi:hypothetical protein